MRCLQADGISVCQTLVMDVPQTRNCSVEVLVVSSSSLNVSLCGQNKIFLHCYSHILTLFSCMLDHDHHDHIR